MYPIRLLLADDHANVRTQIRARLSHENHFEIVGEAADSAQTIKIALAEKPHIVLIDPMMRDGQGLDALRQISTSLPATALVVLTAVSDTATQIELRKLGVRGILNKGIDSQQLVETLREIGERVLIYNHDLGRLS